MAKFSWRRSAVVFAVIPLLALGACSSGGGKTGTASADSAGQAVTTARLKVAMITHAAAGDTFWDIVRKGAETAAKKDNVDLLYSGDADGGRQAQLVQQAIDQKVDGIVVTLAKPEALKAVVKKAVDAGIPVVSMNAGEDESKALGAFTHFGQSDKLAGVTVGERLASEGVQHPICVIMEQGHVGLENRCAGVKENVPGTEILNVNGADMSSVLSTVTAKLQSTPSADAIIGLGAPFTITIVKAVKATGSKVRVASFDLNGELAQEVADGSVEFTVDQQPYLQGYGSVDAIWLNKIGGFKVGGGQQVFTGPAVVDKSNAAAVLKFAKEGIR
ncbi:simple sugar transport system substrate-binding protein [Arthrobacter silviterrae]|uniref:substrate-binding domain-containing protein n=1 Tax=Arthrobacter silviterrae TaxID=2026658 RepID=UPI0027823289|nr:substrate-binding domain-containing protein [Arthrobacter silviterrae]MDQ0276509.1 simple sugar transport system substrate-binding protein [Arthrobacter silviterrae]